MKNFKAINMKNTATGEIRQTWPKEFFEEFDDDLWEDEVFDESLEVGEWVKVEG